MHTALQQPGSRGAAGPDTTLDCEDTSLLGVRLDTGCGLELTEATATLMLEASPIRRVVSPSTLRPVAPCARGLYERGRTQQLNLYAMILCQCNATIPLSKCATGSS